MVGANKGGGVGRQATVISQSGFAKGPRSDQPVGPVTPRMVWAGGSLCILDKKACERPLRLAKASLQAWRLLKALLDQAIRGRASGSDGVENVEMEVVLLATTRCKQCLKFPSFVTPN